MFNKSAFTSLSINEIKTKVISKLAKAEESPEDTIICHRTKIRHYHTNIPSHAKSPIAMIILTIQ